MFHGLGVPLLLGHPPTRVPVFGVRPEDARTPVEHPGVYAYHSAWREKSLRAILVLKRQTLAGDEAFQGQGKGGIHPQPFLDDGAQVRQVLLGLIPRRTWSGDGAFSCSGVEFVRQLGKRSGIFEQVIKDGSERGGDGVTAGIDVHLFRTSSQKLMLLADECVLDTEMQNLRRGTTGSARPSRLDPLLLPPS